MTSYSCLIAILFMVSPGEQGSSASKTEEAETVTPSTEPKNEIIDSVSEDDSSSNEPSEVNWETVIQYDKGLTEGPRQYKSAYFCTYSPMPCVITQDGVLRFNIPESLHGKLQLDMYVFHDGRVNKIDYLQKNSFQDFVIVERILNRQRNKNVWSLSDRIEQRIFDRLYLYGIKLQYKLSEGDPIVLEMYEHDKPETRKTYFFRYHQSGYRYPFDIALIVPINRAQIRFNPNEPKSNQGMFKPALTVGLTANRDPDTHYSLMDKVRMAGYPALFLSWVPRADQAAQELAAAQGLKANETGAIFVGAGVTYFGSLSLGHRNVRSDRAVLGAVAHDGARQVSWLPGALLAVRALPAAPRVRPRGWSRGGVPRDPLLRQASAN